MYIRCFMACALSVIVSSLSFGQVRSYDGTGNNQSNTNWGSAGTSFLRQAPSDYGDGISTPSGSSRPNARELSNVLGNQPGNFADSRNLSSFAWQWGQFLDHDITLTPSDALDPLHIFVNDSNDPLYPIIPMSRSTYDATTGTTTPRQQLNANSSYIDASMVYGSDAGRAAALRTFSGGLMNTSSGNLLPRNTGLLDNANEGPESNQSLFLAGDIRANEQPGLIAMHTIFVREHNRLATQLATVNPGWSDEQIYQHARRMVGGMVQSITYNEYLPAIMGGAAPTLSGASYDSATNATIANEFAGAAFRLGHTQVTNTLMRIQADGQNAAGGHVAMMDSFFKPSLISSSSEIDYFLNGLAHQTQQETDLMIIDDMRNMLFGQPGQGGLDLFAINVQRGRDHGLATYNDVASMFGLAKANDFSDITSDSQLQADLMSLYSSVDEVDLWIGLLAEDKDFQSEMGSLLGTMLNDQFSRLMTGDRFFFMWDSELAQSEIDLLMNTRLSDVIGRNTSLAGLQGNVFFAVPEPSGGWVLLGLLALVQRRRQKLVHEK